MLHIAHEISHFGGTEIIQTRHPKVGTELHEAVDAAREILEQRYGDAHEPNIPEQAVCTTAISLIQHELDSRGFVQIQDGWMELPNCLDKVAVTIRPGDLSFMFYDLAKFQYFFNEAKAEVGVEIVPCHGLHAQMSTGVSYGEQLIHDIERLRKHFPAVPVKIILIDVELSGTERRERDQQIAQRNTAEDIEDQEGAE